MIPITPPIELKRHRFDQELRENVAAVRADGHADANFARPLGDAHEHDVHDADAADDERHTRRSRKAKASSRVKWRWPPVGDFLLVAHREIIIASGPNLCRWRSKRYDLLLGGFDLILDRRSAR